jgi:protein-tyrosine-phosphatase
LLTLTQGAIFSISLDKSKEIEGGFAVPDKVYNVLFLCTGNTARSILAESIMRRDGAGRFSSFSAGSQPKGEVNPFALKVLRAANYPTDGMRSKSWLEFAAPNAPVMDFVFTVCDGAAGEACPVWPGQPMTAHWGIEDPAAVQGPDTEKEAAFVAAFRYLRNRISIFMNLPLRSIDGLSLGAKLREIGKLEGSHALFCIHGDHRRKHRCNRHIRDEESYPLSALTAAF